MSEHDMKHDHKRFKDVIRGKIRKNLKKYVARGENIVRRYKDNDGNVREKILAPMPWIDMPRFTWDDKQRGGVGQGDGKEGDPLSGKEGEDYGDAGEHAGEHLIEEFTMEDFVDLIAEDLELPDLTETAKKFIVDVKNVYRGIQRHGPKGLMHKKRTLKRALARQMSSGNYDPQNPILIPEPPDHRYKGPKPKIVESIRAVVFLMKDCSGSMGAEQNEMLRNLDFWILRWIMRNYKKTDTRFIIHDTDAKEVDEDIFFKMSSNGGTQISSALRLALKIIDEEYPPEDWNIYMLYGSDGDNFDSDNHGCVNLLRSRILPDTVRMFGYTQVKSPYSSNRFKNILEGNFTPKMREKIRIAKMNSIDDTMKAMKKLFGKKK
jgi:hypothetical protein